MLLCGGVAGLCCEATWLVWSRGHLALDSAIGVDLPGLCSRCVQDPVLFFADSGHLGVAYLSELHLQPSSDSWFRLNTVLMACPLVPNPAAFPVLHGIYGDHQVSAKGEAQRDNQGPLPPNPHAPLFLIYSEHFLKEQAHSMQLFPPQVPTGEGPKPPRLPVIAAVS